MDYSKANNCRVKEKSFIKEKILIMKVLKEID